MYMYVYSNDILLLWRESEIDMAKGAHESNVDG